MDDSHLYHERRTQQVDQFERLQESVGNFGRYQWVLFGTANLAYLCITGSLLCNVYDNVKPTCNSTRCHCDNESTTVAMEFDFYSLLIHLGLNCSHRYLPTVMTTSVMVGGVVGAVVFGHLADRFGRKIICEVTLLGCVLSNVLLIASNNWVFASIILTCMGFFGGAYMVVNMVFVLEIVGADWRLFCVTFNGWPLGLMSMALVGFVTRDWRFYHGVTAVLGIPSLLVLIFFLRESPRWLIQHGKLDRAREALMFIAKVNRSAPPDFYLTQLGNNTDVQLKLMKVTTAQSNGSALNHDETNDIELLTTNTDDGDTTAPVELVDSAVKPTYSYWDLVRHRKIFFLVLTMFYSWLVASTISFSLYFTVGNLAGDRYLNTFLLGLLKALSGCIPLAVGKCVGRRPVIIAATLLTSLACWIAVGISAAQPNTFSSTGSLTDRLANSNSLSLTVLALIGASAIDPIWKINHLYSAELFPTVVRNMARGVCNVGSRIGSVIAPQISYLQEILPPLPYVIFGILSTSHLVVCILFLPETQGVPMPDRLPIRKETKSKRNVESPRL